MPESRGRGLAFQRSPKRSRGRAKTCWASIRLDGRRLRECHRQGPRGRGPARGALPGRYRQCGPPTTPWNGGRSYVDLLYPGVTEKFLDITLEAYRREIGQPVRPAACPARSPTSPISARPADCPGRSTCPQLFEKRWGYKLTGQSALPGPARWAIGDRCGTTTSSSCWSSSSSTGASPITIIAQSTAWSSPAITGTTVAQLPHGPDNMAMYAWHQRPAIDCLMNQYREDVHAQFGNARMVRELASVANQLGMQRTLCEAYGAGGWDLRFEDMKRIGDWLEVLGVNTLDQHLSYVTIRGARKADHPQSFSYHEPWWDAYHVLAEYFTRLSLAMSSGEQVNHVLVIEPTTTAWMYQNDPSQAARLKELGDGFQSLVNALEAAQVEYDMASEDIIARHGSLGKLDGSACLVVGKRSYTTVVLPPGVENLNAATMDRLEEYLKAGGRVIACLPAPPLVDGRPSDRGPKAAERATWKRVAATDLPQALLALSHDGFAIHRRSGDAGLLFHQRRRLDDGQLLLLVNTSLQAASVGLIRSPAKGAEEWDCASGHDPALPVRRFRPRPSTQYVLPPGGSLLLFLADKKTLVRRRRRKSKIQNLKCFQSLPDPPARRPAGDPPHWTQRADAGLLDVSAGGSRGPGLYFYNACQFGFQQNGMERDPGTARCSSATS